VKRARGGAITAEQLRSKIDTITTHKYIHNKANQKSFEVAKKWFDETFHQVDNSATWKDALWPNHRQANQTNVSVIQLVNDEKEREADETGYWQMMNRVERITEFLDNFLRERMRKAKRTGIFGGLDKERIDKYKRDAKSIGPFIKALEELRGQWDINTSNPGKGFYRPLTFLTKIISNANTMKYE
jgi:hypothetical protein